ncbi:MAG: hypothetical protein D3903_15005 [Candidatus Electrothrix sp. GM3_4]|nr:hypothetical protein [Candidatus Electrothrix sp. GM3_4]
MSELTINEQSIKNELKPYKEKPYKCLFEYVWNSFDAGARKVEINFSLPKEGLGYVRDVEIIDDGKGWDFTNKLNTETFLSSSKSEINSNKKTLPKGKFGRGRYAFIWIAKKIEIFSHNKKIILNHSTKIDDQYSSKHVNGTRISFCAISSLLSESLLFNKKLYENLLLEFGWFLAGNDNYNIIVNGINIDISEIIKEEKTFNKDFFNKEIKDQLDDFFNVKIISWLKKPSEYSKFYFLDKDAIEIYKDNTGLNKKGDNFWHSVYIKSSIFINSNPIDDKSGQLDIFSDKRINRLRKQIVNQILKELSLIRKPYLVQQSENLLADLKGDHVIPDLKEFGIYDEESYGDLIKTIYTITPSLFTQKSLPEKKFICSTFAGLLSTQDDILIKTILEQLQELTDEEKKNYMIS